MKSYSEYLTYVTLTLIVSCSCALAQDTRQATSESRILFLNFVISGDKAELSEVSVVEGRLKTSRRPDRPHGIRYQLIDDTGKILLEGYESDPVVRRYEFVNDDGELESISVTYDQAPLTVRIPWHRDGETVRISRIHPVTDESGKPSRDPAGKMMTESRLLGEFRLSDYNGR